MIISMKERHITYLFVCKSAYSWELSICDCIFRGLSLFRYNIEIVSLLSQNHGQHLLQNLFLTIELEQLGIYYVAGVTYFRFFGR